MCRSIKQLRNVEIPATDEEIRAAALQFIRKVSGYRKPSKANEEAFETAVEEVADLGCTMACDHESTSIQCGWSLSWDSPLMSGPENFR